MNLWYNGIVCEVAITMIYGGAIVHIKIILWMDLIVQNLVIIMQVLIAEKKRKSTI